MGMSLEELKAANAAAEAELQAETAPIESEEFADAEDELSEESQETAESEGDETQGESLEAWMLADEQTSDEGDAAEESKFTSSDVASVRRKYKEKLKRQASEVDRLKAEIEQLKSAKTKVIDEPIKPTMESCGFDDAKFANELERYYSEINSRKEAEVKHAKQVESFEAQREAALDEHAERIEKLLSKGGMDENRYFELHNKARDAIESLAPNSFEFIVSSLGAGSEKVMFSIGANPARLQKLTDTLKADPTGLRAMAYLGELKGQLANASPMKARKAKEPSKSPTPTAGDASGVAMREKYRKATDLQARIDLKRAAKAKGINTQDW